MLGILCTNASNSSAHHDDRRINDDDASSSIIDTKNKDKTSRRKQVKPNRLVLQKTSKMMTAMNLNQNVMTSSSCSTQDLYSALVDGSSSDPGLNGNENNTIAANNCNDDMVEHNRHCSSAPCSPTQKKISIRKRLRISKTNQDRILLGNMFNATCCPQIGSEGKALSRSESDIYESQTSTSSRSEPLGFNRCCMTPPTINAARPSEKTRNKRKRTSNNNSKLRESKFGGRREQQTTAVDMSVLDLTSYGGRKMHIEGTGFAENLSEDCVMTANDYARNSSSNEECSYCNASLSSPSALHFHMFSEHGVIQDQINSMAGQFDQHNFDKVSTLIKEVAGNYSSSSRNRDYSSEQDELGKISDGSNQDDFCDVCQKHFCNKYYLRKHKADVHGIYTDYVRPAKAIVSSSSSTKNQTAKTFGSINMAPKSNSPTLGSPMSQVTEPSAAMHLMNPYFGNLLNPQAARPSLLDQKYSSSLFSRNNLTFGATDDSSDLHKLPASCPVCKKEFFNGEYLRLHILNRHSNYSTGKSPFVGCDVEDCCEDNQNEAVAMINANKDDGNDDDMATNNEYYQHDDNLNRDDKNGHIWDKTLAACTTEDCSLHKSEESVSSAKNASNEQVQNSLDAVYSTMKDHFLPFGRGNNDYDHFKVDSKLFLCSSTDTAVMGSLDERVFSSSLTTSSINGISNNCSGVQAGVVAKSYQPIAMSAVTDSALAAKLAERVVCDICNKQVCNKYFLKTHKSRVHGISSSADNKSENASSSFNNVHSSRSVQGHKQSMRNSCSPSNREEASMSCSAGGSSQDDLQQSELMCLNVMSEQERNDLLKNSIDPEAYCTICKKEFCSKYFLRTHQQNIHKMKHSSVISVAPKRVKSSPKDPLKAKSLSPAQTRVTCSICNKELCNKYFLRSHMMNVHNIAGEELKKDDDNRTPSSSSTVVKSERFEYPQILSNNYQQRSERSPITCDDNQSSLFKCPICGECLNSQNDCSEHSRRVHGVTAGAALVAKRPFNNIGAMDQQSTTDIAAQPSKCKESRLDFPGFSGMQPFIFESDDSRFSEFFVPCMVYLPIKSRVHNTVSFSLRLKPVGHENIFQNHR